VSEPKNISRRELLKTLSAIAGACMMTPLDELASAQTSSSKNVAASPMPSATAQGNTEKPNILWINAEGVPVSMLGCYGSLLMQTPNIDRIAREGMLFRNAFCTNALCAPSRGTLLTGKYAHLHGMTGNGGPDDEVSMSNPRRYDPSQETFVRIMRAHGYQTGHAGKWHVPGTPGDAGFDAFIYKYGAGTHYYEPHWLANGAPGNDTVTRKVITGYETDVTADFTIDFMKQAKAPFLMMFQSFNDHRPFEPPHKYEHLYDHRRIPEPGTFWDDYSMRASAVRRAEMRIVDMADFNPPKELTERQRKQWNYQQFMAHFMGALRSFDDNVGRILDYLDQSGLAKNTIVVFTGDHGFFVGEHGWFDKRMMMEQAIRVPWMIRWPGRIKPGSETDAWTINIDNAPTALDLAGLSIPPDMQGKSLKTWLEGNTPSDWQRAFYYHYYEYPGPHWVEPHYGIRTERYKLINFYQQNEWELFDLQRDPDEMENLLDPESYALHAGYVPVARQLAVQLQALRSQYKDDTGAPVRFELPMQGPP
jgi:arylsulfatase A-like enzyme